MPGEEADDLSDAQLLARCAAGQRGACGAVLARHLDAVHRYARAVTGDAVAADDVAQEAFVAAIRAAGTFAGAGSARSWLLAITRNAAHRLHRRRVGQPAALEPLDELGVAAGWGDPEAELASAEAHDAFARALAALSPEDREVLVLRELEGLDGQETAAVLGVPLPTMKTRLHRARLRLAAELTRSPSGPPGGPHDP